MAATSDWLGLSDAQHAFGLSYTHIRRLIAAGRVRSKWAAKGDHADGRVKLLVSKRSLAAYKGHRKAKAKP
jgi:hypothetical protein